MEPQSGNLSRIPGRIKGLLCCDPEYVVVCERFRCASKNGEADEYHCSKCMQQMRVDARRCPETSGSHAPTSRNSICEPTLHNVGMFSFL
jgi:hypothetical protein